MGMREKLIELIGNTHYGKNDASLVGENFQEGFIAKIADNLIANGVTIPVLCKDCVHMKNQFHARFCNVWCMYNGMGDEGFCNYGERKDNG